MANSISNNSHHLIQADVDFILSKVGSELLELRGQHLFVTGGTGFFGHWLLDTLQRANRVLDLGVEVTVLTRDITLFKNQADYLFADESFHFIEGDIRNFEWPKGTFKTIIHAATTRAEETFNHEDALKKFETVSQGTQRLLQFACKAGTEKILWTSSGAVYGQQPAELERISETYSGCVESMDPDRAALGLGKKVAEFYCAYYGQKHGIDIKIARCFSFVGPRMQMNIHYAIGNFIADEVSGKEIVVTGDGTPIRSYLYIADLIIWLWTILLRGQSLYPYNVGSDEAVNMADLARLVSDCGGRGNRIQILKDNKSGLPINRYLPDLTRIKSSLGVRAFFTLQAAIQKTIEYERCELGLPVAN